MYKIYINEKVLIIAKPGEKLPDYMNLIPIDYKSILSVFKNFASIDLHDGWLLLSQDPAKDLKQISGNFELIVAAGGLVRNSEDAYLFIFRRGKWDLPKGKLDKDERVEDAAIREVQEECGISEIKLGNLINETYHIYIEKKKNILKHTFWYEMFCNETELVPQLDEGITEVRWIRKEDFDQIYSNTYSSIVDVLKFAE